MKNPIFESEMPDPSMITNPAEKQRITDLVAITRRRNVALFKYLTASVGQATIGKDVKMALLKQTQNDGITA